MRGRWSCSTAATAAGADAFDAAVRAAASLALALARAGGCSLLLAPERRAHGSTRALASWPRIHARLALIEPSEALAWEVDPRSLLRAVGQRERRRARARAYRRRRVLRRVALPSRPRARCCSRSRAALFSACAGAPGRPPEMSAWAQARVAPVAVHGARGERRLARPVAAAAHFFAGTALARLAYATAAAPPSGRSGGAVAAVATASGGPCRWAGGGRPAARENRCAAGANRASPWPCS